MSILRRYALLIAVLLMTMSQSSQLSAQSNPNFRLEFGQFVPITSDTHFDTHNIVVGKPVKTLTLSMKSSGDPDYGDMHLSGSQILLDLSNATVTSYVNNASELSVSAQFNTFLPAGTYPATKVVFGFADGYFHNTFGEASGIFLDGEPFYVSTYAGLIPEPSTYCLLATAAALLMLRGIRQRKAKIAALAA